MRTLGITDAEFMTAQDQMLCQRCHEHPATVYMCDGNSGESKHLCEQCYRASATPEELASSDQFRDLVRNGKCRYCGAPAECGFGSFSSAAGENFELLCRACHQDLGDFARRPENTIPDVPDHAAAFRDEEFMRRRLQQYADRERRQDEFMKQRIAERKSTP